MMPERVVAGWRRTAVVRSWCYLVVFLAASCTGASHLPPGPSGAQPRVLEPGGTLRAAFVLDPDVPDTFDPQRAFDYSTWEIMRCCLARTLLSYNGRSTGQGGEEVRPDLAASMPSVSADGLTWTFTMQSGLHYGPPFEDTEIVAGDVVRALEREARVSLYAFYFEVIDGFSEYEAKTADSISGLRTPDRHTLVIRLTRPTGDLGYRLALPGAAPIPARAATGHKDYGRFLVSSGPYMFEGSEDLGAGAGDTPVAGYVLPFSTDTSYTQGSITLVRNPSWQSASDPLRAAYADRIEVSIGGFDVKDSAHYDYGRSLRRLFDDVVAGRLDIVLDTSPPLDQLRRFHADPQQRDALHVDEITFPEFIAMNLGVPPFDDVHVRRAVNLAIDKTKLQRDWVAASSGQDIPESTGGVVVADHLAPNALEGNLLGTYLPGWMTSEGGGEGSARSEMSRSRYDNDGDGLCDAPVCSNVALAETTAWPSAFGRVGRARPRLDRHPRRHQALRGTYH